MILKPGQLCTIRNHVYRAKKRTAGCSGCLFEYSFFTCPGMLDFKRHVKHVDCVVSNIILTKVT